MSKQDLIEFLYKRQNHRGLTRKNIEDVVDTFFLHLSNMIVRRKEFSCPKFGNFQVQKRKKTKIRHPQTGEWMDVPSRKTISFYASPVLTKKVNS
ncbi:MAG: HU family DNA-binding protein [Bdellovibrionales bacterium]|nr:HU family DNA-binding protein [Bdellovibrionales bacterium]